MLTSLDIPLSFTVLILGKLYYVSTLQFLFRQKGQISNLSFFLLSQLELLRKDFSVLLLYNDTGTQFNFMPVLPTS